MATCPDGSQTVLGVCPSSGSINIQCIPPVNGTPTYTPAVDQIPLAYDGTTGILWIHTCPNNWTPFSFSLCGLPASIGLGGIVDPCTAIGLPITIDNGAGCSEGIIPLGDISDAIIDCSSNIPTSVVVGGTDIAVTNVVSGNVTTYTVSVDTDASVVNQVVITGNVIASHDDGDGVVTDIIETTTLLSSDGSGGFNYTNESGNVVNIPASSLGVVSVVTPTVAVGNQIATHDDGNGNVQIINETITNIVSDGANGINYTDEAGIVQNISAAQLGTPGDTSVVTPTVVVGNQIATHDDGTGNVQNIIETITDLSSDGANGINYTDEDGVVQNIPAAQLGTVSSGNTSVVTPVVTVGNQIATHNDGTGNVQNIIETITDLSSDGANGLNYTDEAGVVQNIPALQLGATSSSVNVSAPVVQVDNVNDFNVVNNQVYNRVDPNKQVLVIITSSLSLNYSPVNDGYNATLLPHFDVILRAKMQATINASPIIINDLFFNTLGAERAQSIMGDFIGLINTFSYQTLVNAATVTVSLDVIDNQSSIGVTPIINPIAAGSMSAGNSSTVDNQIIFIEV